MAEYVQTGSVQEPADLVKVMYGILNTGGIALEEHEELRLVPDVFRAGQKTAIADEDLS